MHAVVAGAEALGVQSVMMDSGTSAQVRVWTDSNAAKAIARRDLRKTRYVELKFLWLQVTKSGSVNIRRAPGEQHLADQLTEGTSWREIDNLIRQVRGRMQLSQGNNGNEHVWMK